MEYNRNIHVIKLDIDQKPRFCMIASKRISEMLNTKITFTEVLDELFLYEMGSDGSNKTLRHFIVSMLEDCTVYWVNNDPGRGSKVSHSVGIL